MINVRVFFSKTGRVRFISHLDLNRTMTRILRRTDLPIWYTEGFNKHPYVTFAAPLSLGYEGLQETMDFRLTQDDVPMERVCQQLNEVLPQGLYVISADVAQQKPGQIGFARYQLYLSCEARWMEQLLDMPQIEVQKRTKSGAMRTVDLRPHLHDVSYDAQQGCWQVTLPCGSENSLNPSLLVTALQQNFPQQDITALRIVRTAVLNQQGELFK